MAKFEELKMNIEINEPITKLEYFAAKAMQSLLINFTIQSYDDYRAIALKSKLMASAMIEEMKIISNE
jgi:hypothetical protein